MKVISTKEELKEILGKYYCYATDYDGTIIDSMPLWHHFASEYLKSKGIDAEPLLDTKMKYISNLDAARIIYNKYHILNNSTEVCDDINRFMQNKYKTIPLKKGAKEFLELLSRSGRNLLSSATRQSLLMLSLRALGILGYYKDIYSSSDLDKSKESGELFKYIIKEENIKRNNMLVIEDSILAMKICKKMKIDTLIVKDYSNRNYLDDINKYATYYIDIEEVFKND